MHTRARRSLLVIAALLFAVSACLPSPEEIARKNGGDSTGDDTGSGNVTQGESIHVQPTRLDYLVESLEPMVQSFTITNMGDDLLAVMDIVVSGSSDFSMPNENWAQSLEPGDSMEVQVALTPSGEEATGEVIISSTDESAPVVLVDLHANSFQPEGPQAVCSIDPSETSTSEPATWIGEHSFDPTGGTIVSWSWTLESAPPGSAVAMPEGEANRSSFAPDLPGEYIGQLIVTNDAGVQSEPCLATLLVEATEGIWIAMVWTHAGDDMDLHFIAPGGFYEDGSNWDNDTDCHWRNCTWDGVNWGSQSSTEDDPALVLDDITGTGPEAISLPAPVPGTYTVAVHDYPGSDYSESNPVTVNVYILGSLAWTNTRDVTGEDTVTYFAEITWSGGTGTVSEL